MKVVVVGLLFKVALLNAKETLDGLLVESVPRDPGVAASV
jgi:hypothetical protein